MRDTFAVGCVCIAWVLGQEERQSEGTGRFLVDILAYSHMSANLL